MSPDRSQRDRPSRGKSLIPDPALRNPARIIYAVAEGQVTEPDYCTALNNAFSSSHHFQINTKYSRKEGLKPLEVADLAVQVASETRNEEEFGADTSPHPLREVWALFDRDEHPDVRQAFDRLRQHNAEANGEPGVLEVQAAFSHPSFDLWLLLHFQALTSPQDGASEYIHEKLRGYPGFKQFAKDKSRSKAITEERAAQLMRPERIEAAIRNARALIKACPSTRCSPDVGHADDCDPLRRDPSTDVWRLITALGLRT